MDRYIIASLVMLAVWAALTLFTEAPGAVHLLLTGGLFLLIWRIVARDTPAGPAKSPGQKP